MDITTFCIGAFVGSIVTFVAMCISYISESHNKDNELREQLEEVRQEHYIECGQIAHYEDENKELKQKVEQLIKKYESEM